MQLVPETKVYQIRKHIIIPYNKVLFKYKMTTQKLTNSYLTTLLQVNQTVLF